MLLSYKSPCLSPFGDTSLVGDSNGGKSYDFPYTWTVHKTCQSEQKGYICLTLAGDAGVSGGEERSEGSGMI